MLDRPLTPIHTRELEMFRERAALRAYADPNARHARSAHPPPVQSRFAVTRSTFVRHHLALHQADPRWRERAYGTVCRVLAFDGIIEVSLALVRETPAPLSTLLFARPARASTLSSSHQK